MGESLDQIMSAAEEGGEEAAAATKGMAGEIDFQQTEEAAEKGIDILAKSLNKSLSDYDKHPLVEIADKLGDTQEVEKGIKQALRGIEGITGKDSQLAIMDVLSGAIRLVKAASKTAGGGEK